METALLKRLQEHEDAIFASQWDPLGKSLAVGDYVATLETELAKAQAIGFRVGDRVRHPKFGEGEVVALTMDGIVSVLWENPVQRMLGPQPFPQGKGLQKLPPPKYAVAKKVAGAQLRKAEVPAPPERLVRAVKLFIIRQRRAAGSPAQIQGVPPRRPITTGEVSAAFDAKVARDEFSEYREDVYRALGGDYKRDAKGNPEDYNDYVKLEEASQEMFYQIARAINGRAYPGEPKRAVAKARGPARAPDWESALAEAEGALNKAHVALSDFVFFGSDEDVTWDRSTVLRIRRLLKKVQDIGDWSSDLESLLMRIETDEAARRGRAAREQE